MEASGENIELADTALGRLQKKKKTYFMQTARKFTEEEWAEMTAARNLDLQSKVSSENGTADDEGAA